MTRFADAHSRAVTETVVRPNPAPPAVRPTMIEVLYQKRRSFCKPSWATIITSPIRMKRGMANKMKFWRPNCIFWESTENWKIEPPTRVAARAEIPRAMATGRPISTSL